MVDRTATRHQRRCIDRRQMVKRLFRLIWQEYFNLEWDVDIQQTISFLLNRRGFSYLTEEYDPDKLREFPQDVYKHLPQELQGGAQNNDGTYDLVAAIQAWQEDESILEKYNIIDKKIRDAKSYLFGMKRIEILRQYCQKRCDDKIIPNEKNKARIKLSETPEWLIDTWRKQGIKGINAIEIAKKSCRCTRVFE